MIMNLPRTAVVAAISALLLGLADADDRNQAGAPDGFRLLVHHNIALTMIGATFGVADDDRTGAGISQHLG